MSDAAYDEGAYERDLCEIRLIQLCQDSCVHPMFRHGIPFRNILLSKFHRYAVEAIEILSAKIKSSSLEESIELNAKFRQLFPDYLAFIEDEPFDFAFDIWKALCGAAGRDAMEPLDDSHLEQLKPFALRIPLGTALPFYNVEDAIWCPAETACFWQSALRVLSATWRAYRTFNRWCCCNVTRDHATANASETLDEVLAIEREIFACWNTSTNEDGLEQVEPVLTSPDDPMQIASELRVNSRSILLTMGKHKLRNGNPKSMIFITKTCFTDKGGSYVDPPDWTRSFNSLRDKGLTEGIRGKGIQLTPLGWRVCQEIKRQDREKL